MAADTKKKSPANAALKRYRLRSELKAARQAAGLTQHKVARTLDWSPSKVIRIEHGDVSVSTTDLRALLETYRIQDRFADLSELAKGSRKQPWAKYSDLFGPELRQFFGYEASARTIRQSESALVPALLQTDDYAAAVLRDVYGLAPADVQRNLEVRRSRREVLSPRSNPLEAQFILAEPVLRWRVGGASVMREQVESLRNIAHQDNGVSIQVLPFTAGANFGMQGPFEHLEFADDAGDVLFLESPPKQKVLREDTKVIRTYREGFAALHRAASPPAELDRYLDAVLAAL